MTGVGVVVLDMDQPALTARCLNSLASGSRHPSLVVLIENGIRPFAHPEPKDEWNGIPFVTLRANRNLHCASGRNLGLNYLYSNTRIPIFITLDNDTVVPPDFIKAIESSPPSQLQVLAPIIVELSSNKVWSSGGLLHSDGSVQQLDDWPTAADQRRKVDWAPGACLIMQRKTWNAVGAFDQWIEFWCVRLKQLGGEVEISQELRLEHEPHQSLGGRWSPARTRYWARNGTLLHCSVLGTKGWPLIKWLTTETLLCVRDLFFGRPRWTIARFVGLSQGLIESWRRANNKEAT